MHPKLEKRLRERYDIKNDEELIPKLHALLGDHLEYPEFIGMGGEGVVFKDESLVKKFILNWEKCITIDQIFSNLLILSKKLETPMHLYRFKVEMIADEILMISYNYEVGDTLTELYISKYWHTDLVNQYYSLQNELLEARYWLTNPKLKNFIIVDGLLKLVDYGADCLPLDDAIPEVGRMYFMLLNQIYKLGR